MNPSIAIVDDHQLYLSGLAQLLEKNLHFPIVGKFKNGKEVMDFLEKGHEIDLLIMDLNMPVMNGYTLMTKLKRYPQVKKLVLSMHADAMTISRTRALGADGYLNKDAVWSEVEMAINIILSGGTYFITDDLAIESNAYTFQLEMIVNQYRLTKREMQILQLIVKECLTTEIAVKLSASPYTIRTHRRNIFRKLGVRNLAGLMTVLSGLGYKNKS